MQKVGGVEWRDVFICLAFPLTVTEAAFLETKKYFFVIYRKMFKVIQLDE